MNDEISFKLTFNKPAEQSFFSNDRGDKFTGLQIKFDPQGALQFRPVSFQRERDDVASLSERKRGGCAVVIEGSMAGAILGKLRDKATPQKPFFTLTRLGKGWFEVEHYDGPDAPAKIVPHMRLWTQREEEEADDAALSQEAQDFIAKVRSAQQTIADHIHDRRIGRPPREVADARKTLSDFERVVGELIPERAPPKLDLRALSEAYSLIGAVMASARDASVMNTPVATFTPAPTPPAPKESAPTSETKAAASKSGRGGRASAKTADTESKEPEPDKEPVAEKEPVKEPVAEKEPVKEPVIEKEPVKEPVAEKEPETVKETAPPARRTLFPPQSAAQPTKNAGSVEEEEGLSYEPDPDFMEAQAREQEPVVRRETDDEIAERENLETQHRLGMLRPPPGLRRRRRAA